MLLSSSLPLVNFLIMCIWSYAHVKCALQIINITIIILLNTCSQWDTAGQLYYTILTHFMLRKPR